MVLPTVGAEGTDLTPSMFGMKLMKPGSVSFQLSTASVVASVPVPLIGHTLPCSMGIGGGFGALSLSALVMPVAMFGRQLELCQSGELSLRTRKFEPPTI